MVLYALLSATSQRWKLIELMSTPECVCYEQKYTLKVANQDFVAVDMPGTLNQRVSWVAEIEKANGVVFFVDSTDEMRFSVGWGQADYKSIIKYCTSRELLYLTYTRLDLYAREVTSFSNL